MRSVSSSLDVHGISYTDKTKRLQRLKKIQRVQKVNEVKESTYYDKRGLTQLEQTGEVSLNLSAKEIFEIERAKSHNSKAYAKLNKLEKEKVRDFKNDYVSKDGSQYVQTEKTNIETHIEEQER